MARKTKTALSLVTAPSSSDDALDVLSDAVARAMDGEVLAVAVIEIRREGVISHTYVGHEIGFRHQLVAATQYLLADLMADDE